MQFIKPAVQTICCGIAMSMGALILAGGAKGKRAVLPNSRVLIHQVTGGYQGQTTDIEIHANEALALRDILEGLYAKHTGQDRATLRDDMDRDHFMSPEKAVKYGLADRVLETRAE